MKKTTTITYTSRKGLTYYLCKRKTKTGKPRFYFARSLKGEPVEEIPDGYEIRESVNGIVSLAKARPMKILPSEANLVKEALKKHPKANRFRVNVKHDRILVYELVGPDTETLSGIFGNENTASPELFERIRANEERYGQYRAILQFILHDKKTRTFQAERANYHGPIDGWLPIRFDQPLSELSQELIPLLGTDLFYELYI